MVIWLYCFLGFGATSGASGRIALTIGATVTTRAGKLLKLQEQLFKKPGSVVSAQATAGADSCDQVYISKLIKFTFPTKVNLNNKLRNR